jgi:hypothetical protein
MKLALRFILMFLFRSLLLFFIVFIQIVFKYVNNTP